MNRLTATHSHHLCHIATGKFFNFLLPLVFQRCRTHHEHTVGHALSQIDLCGGNGLYGLAQSHLIGNDGFTCLDGKAYALFLIGIEAHREQAVERIVAIFAFYQLEAVCLLTLADDQV